MVDSGCNTILLPLAEGQLETFPELFPKSDFDWIVSQSKGVSSSTPTLLIEPKTGDSIEAHLLKSYFKTPQLHLELLRFHLCSDDYELMLKTPKLLDGVLSLEGEPFDPKELHVQSDKIPRRTHALLGQLAMLSRFHLSFQHDQYWALVDLNVFKRDIRTLFSSLKFFVGGPLNLPDQFDDLEDEDHDFVNSGRSSPKKPARELFEDE